MSRRFLIATLFIILLFVGGFMTANGWSFWPEAVLMVGGFLGAVVSLFTLNNKWGNKKLF